MQEEKRIPNDEEWVRCKKCGHKLFRMISRRPLTFEVKAEGFEAGVNYSNKLEIKCHSCKEINEITL